MLDIHVNDPDDEDGDDVRIYAKSQSISDILSDCLLVVQGMFAMLCEYDVSYAFEFASECSEGSPFLSYLSSIQNKEDDDDDDVDNEDEYPNDLKPIFKGILYTKGKSKGDSDSDED